MTTENRADLTQVSLVFAHTSTHKDQRLSILLFLGGKSGLITHNQNLYVNKKMGKNLFLQNVAKHRFFSLERDFQDCDCDVEPILYIFFLVKAFSKHRETSTVGWLILLSKSPPLMSLSTFDTTSIMATNVLFHLFTQNWIMSDNTDHFYQVCAKKFKNFPK